MYMYIIQAHTSTPSDERAASTCRRSIDGCMNSISYPMNSISYSMNSISYPMNSISYFTPQLPSGEPAESTCHARRA